MFCKNCGSNVEDGHKFCPNCGKEVEETTTVYTEDLDANRYSDQNYTLNQAPNQDYNSNGNYVLNDKTINPNDKKSVGLNILCFFFPVIGLILYLVQKDTKPVQSKSLGKSAIIGFVIGMIMSIGVSVLPVLIASSDNDYSISDFENFNDEDDEYITDDAEENEIQTTDSETTQSNNIAGVTTSTKWTDYEAIVNGKMVKLPLSYANFVKTTGLMLDDKDDEQSTLKGNQYDSITFKDKNDKNILAYVYNDSDSVKTIPECTVAGIFEYNNSNNTEHVMEFCGFSIGQKTTVDEIKAVFGEPSDVYDNTDDGSEYHRLTYYEDHDKYYSQHSLEITIYNGVITDLSVERVG